MTRLLKRISASLKIFTMKKKIYEWILSTNIVGKTEEDYEFTSTLAEAEIMHDKLPKLSECNPN
ncbi:hypothetical protein CHS0354_033736 [Potamilus streckersoni]|uniref:Uncharacterized protein n=1 Tax=Potamilus streckersoni TaxID=2493646 RepID=A0AAE0S2V8_9BIVA|nr:hypothetical protein CHS0354_033736 [Potamilus streckersoni]